jgi:hypothetical protein
MAILLNNKAGLKLGATSPAAIDLTSFVTSITINRAFDELEVSALGDTGHKYVKGLESSTITVDFLNDQGTSGVLQTLQTLWGTNAYFKIIGSTDTTTYPVGVGNPIYSGLILVNNTTDVNGAVGDLQTQSITFNVSGAITVATTGTF